MSMSDETKEPEAPAEPEKKPPSWEYKTEFGVNQKLKDVVTKAIDVTSTEIDRLKRQLDKLTYGS